MKLPHKEKTIIPPKEGWLPKSYYVVKVAHKSNNPIHVSIFYSGYLSKTGPAAYNQIWNATYEETYKIFEVHYLEVVRRISTDS